MLQESVFIYMNIIEIINEELKQWYHGTPDVRDIKTAGAFTPRTDTTTYISDPQKWDEQQVEMNNAKKSGNEALYFELLHEHGKLVKDLTFKKPIYFTGNRSVARTYANPWRAFDYQNSEPSVLMAKIDDSGKILTIPAHGDNFRGINSDIVKKALMADGVSENVINDFYRKFQFWVSNGRMTAETLGIIAQLLKYDIVDVLNVIDTHTGKGAPSTVRMVFDPSRIKISN
jgi:hypothetical protein